MIRLPNDGTSERQYLDLVQEIIDDGDYRCDRTGVGAYSLHGRTMRYDLSDGTWPLLTTKRIPWKSVANELFWFLRGETNIRWLLQNKCTIWSEWPHKKYVQETGEAMSLQDFEQRILDDEAFAEQWGSIGRGSYGAVWRRWEGTDGRVHDQIADLMHRLRTDKYSRRLLFHGWNVGELDHALLPACHLLYQLHVSKNDRLSLSLYQRSVDSALGLPFNAASGSLLLHMIAHQADMQVGDLFWIGHDVHLYANHVESIKEQLARTPTPFPKLRFKRKPSSLFDYTIDDIEPVGYVPQKSIPMPVAV